MSAHPSFTSTGDEHAASLWNGPVCQVCGACYLGIHECKGHRCDALDAAEAAIARVRAALGEAVIVFAEGIDLDGCEVIETRHILAALDGTP